ncbi:hypothetical protein WA026_009288 [Henosepilachna vigintioctopunctata]|uniref:Uncharacterized protein n=1 Tax=Henosepilachna vigintioctopunctata TaxID=420089 RepID=A0AAW1UYM0_9CUCU
MLKKLMSIPSVGYSRYNFQTTLMGLMLLGGLTTCLGDPETKLENKEWWRDPCRQVIPPIPEKLRHGRSAGIRNEIRDQLNILITENKKNLRELKHLYWKGTRPKLPAGKFKWLKLRKMIKDMQSPNGNIELRNLHKSLQIFAGTLEKLSHIRLKTQGKFDKRKRDFILHDTKKSFKAFICSVQEALQKNLQKSGKPIHFDDVLSKINLTEHSDLTELSYLDVTILKKLKKFLDKVKTLLEKSITRRKRRKNINKKNENLSRRRLRNRHS